MSDVRETLEAAYDEIASTEGHSLPEPEERLGDPTPPDGATLKGDRSRDEAGRFASKGNNENANEASEPPAAVDTKSASMGKPDPNAEPSETRAPAAPNGAADPSVPPQRVGAATKASWNDLPEAIRKEIWDREERMDRGMARYTGLAEYAAEAEKNGQTLREVMQAYKNAEDNLISNPVATLAEFCKMTNTNPLQIAQFLGLPVGQPHSPAMTQSAPQGYQPLPADPRVDELLRWQRDLAQREAAREAAQVNNEVESFLKDTKRFPYAENVRVTMGRLLETGMANSLEDAYQQAIYLDPTVRKLVEEENFKTRMSSVQQQQSVQNNRAAVQQAKQSAGSLSGSPVAGGRSSSTSSGPKSVADSLREAYDSLAG